jgi:hypothetical protein
MSSERPIIETTTYVHCPKDHKNVARFNERGLLAFCKVCHNEQVISWAEIERIRAGLAQEMKREAS